MEVKMTNKERQNSLDKQKWINSEDYGYDLSGSMPYCEFCEIQKNCQRVPHQEKSSKFLCAKAFNRMERKKV